MNRKNNKKGRRKLKGSVVRFLTGLIVIAAVLCIILFTNSNVIRADGDAAPERTRYYETITIKAGDTLWSIASEYRTSEYKDNRDYVEDLMYVNSLDSEYITAGQNLIIIRYR